MDSDFFTDGYAAQRELEEIESRLTELRLELNSGQGSSTGRSDKDLEAQIEELLKRKAEVQKKLAHEEEAR